MNDIPGVAYLADRISRSGLTNLEIAKAVGFPRPNVVAMLKNNMQLPLDKVVGMADVLGVDRAEMFRETRPNEWKVVLEVFSTPDQKEFLS